MPYFKGTKGVEITNSNLYDIQGNATFNLTGGAESTTNDKAVVLIRYTDGPIGEELKALVCQISIVAHPCLHLHVTWVVRESLDRRNDKSLCQTGEAYFGERPSFHAQFLSQIFTFRASRSAIYHAPTLPSTIIHLKTRNALHASRTRGKPS